MEKEIVRVKKVVDYLRDMQVGETLTFSHENVGWRTVRNTAHRLGAKNFKVNKSGDVVTVKKLKL
jgi:hypothetical protein